MKRHAYAYLVRLLAIIALIHLVFPKDTYAYLDPGTGSYFLQLIVAVLLGGLFAVKLFWQRIKASFRHLFSKMRKHKKDGSQK